MSGSLGYSSIMYSARGWLWKLNAVILEIQGVRDAMDPEQRQYISHVVADRQDRPPWRRPSKKGARAAQDAPSSRRPAAPAAAMFPGLAALPQGQILESPQAPRMRAPVEEPEAWPGQGPWTPAAAARLEARSGSHGQAPAGSAASGELEGRRGADPEAPGPVTVSAGRKRKRLDPALSVCSSPAGLSLDSCRTEAMRSGSLARGRADPPLSPPTAS